MALGTLEPLLLLVALFVQHAFPFVVPPSSKFSFRQVHQELNGSTIDNNVELNVFGGSRHVEPSQRRDVDPLITRILLENGEASTLLGGAFSASDGIAVWRSVLLKGRLPTKSDFTAPAFEVWPPRPLFDALCHEMTELQFPIFVMKHNEVVNTVLRTLIQITIQFTRISGPTYPPDDNFTERENLERSETSEATTTSEGFIREEQEMQLQDTEVERLALELVSEQLTKPWEVVISGIGALDLLFGTSHELLDNDDIGVGFGLHDGVWAHSGWKAMKSLQQEISSIQELRDLIQQLGRRPTVEDQDSITKFTPRKEDNQGNLGAQHDPSRRTSIQGITLSGNLSEMLPSEAMLLGSKKNAKEKAAMGRQQMALRRLFLAKMVEKKLLSYESSGWNDIPSSKIPNTHHLMRLPSAPGGPIMICLDTSWSMTGRREVLSKAVVLACVIAAHEQKRDVQVVAFSSERNVMETGPIAANKEGVRRLLEFLSSSFGGGTDVTGALTHIMNMLSIESEEEHSQDRQTQLLHGTPAKSFNDMRSADLLLVTDGEIPDPPVPETMLAEITNLKQKAGVQIHGLLVGKSTSAPLQKICTHVHNFLTKYESLIPEPPAELIATGSAHLESATVLMTEQTRRKSRARSTELFLRRSFLDTSYRCSVKQSRYDFRLSATRSSSWEFDDDSDYENWVDRGKRRPRNRKSIKKPRTKQNPEDKDHSALQAINAMNFGTGVEDSKDPKELATSTIDYVRSLREYARKAIEENEWKPATLEEEKNSVESCWEFRKYFHEAVESVSEGLVERDQEARLVVLGLLAQEHILLLGPPGTAKSVLGRRLSDLCGGFFFQRLLTRFTTPEEIFGPLSLRALERDEYRRKTDGFLPTAHVAFLDEIFKANSAILNTLLTILNERQFDNGAGVRDQCPIQCVIGASNELPESEELDALYDRFLLRKEVLPVSDDGVLVMLGAGKSSPLPSQRQTESLKQGIRTTGLQSDLDVFIQEIDRAAEIVEMDHDSCALMRDMRKFMKTELGVDISDRRLVRAMRILKVSAASHGRSKVDPIDCLLLQHVAWRLPEQRTAIRQWLWNYVTPGSLSLSLPIIEDGSIEFSAAASTKQFLLLLDGIRNEAIASVRRTSGDITGSRGARTSDVAAIRSLSQEASEIARALQQRSNDLRRHIELLQRAEDHLWLDSDEATAAKQLLLPRAIGFLNATEDALQLALCLESVLSESTGTSIADEDRVMVLEALRDEVSEEEFRFSEGALMMTMREAKAKYDPETFRKWKRARKNSDQY